MPAPLKLDDLPLGVGATLQWLLRLTFEPVVTIEEYWEQQRKPLLRRDLESTSRPVLFAIEGEPEAVVVGPYTIANGQGLADVEGSYLSVSVASQRTPLEHALAVATAVAIGRELGTSILDDGRFYSAALEISPNDLANALRVPIACGNYRDAAQLMHANLPSTVPFINQR